MAHELSKYWFNMTYTKEQKYEHDGGRSQGRMMNCFGTFNFLSICLSAFVTHWVSCWWRWLCVSACVCVCAHVCSLCVNVWCYSMSHSWLHFCLYCHTVTVYMCEWFVYSLSKDQFPLCVHIAVSGYFQGWNCPSEHLREHLNVLFTQH